MEQGLFTLSDHVELLSPTVHRFPPLVPRGSEGHVAHCRGQVGADLCAQVSQEGRREEAAGCLPRGRRRLDRRSVAPRSVCSFAQWLTATWKSRLVLLLIQFHA